MDDKITLERREETRKRLVAELEELVEKAGEEKRDLSPEEKTRYDDLKDHLQTIQGLNQEYMRESAELREALLNQPTDGQRRLGLTTTSGRGDGFRFRDSSGKEYRALTNTESLADRVIDPEEGSSFAREPFAFGRMVVAALTGKLNSLPEAERRAALGGADISGGYLLTPALGSRVIDLARANSVAFKAGCQLLPMSIAELHLARIATDPTAYWRAETVAITSSDVVLEQVILKPRTLACIIPVSIELLEDAENAGAMIEQTITKAMAAELDRVILQGDGAGAEPIGIRNATGTNALTSVGVPTDWANPSAAVADILTANFPGDVSELAWIQHPAIAELTDSYSDTTGQPLSMTPWVSKLQRFFTTNLPSTEGAGSDEHVDIIGPFREVVVGTRTTGMVVEVLREGTVTDASSDTWNASTQMLRHVRVYLRADVALMQPSWFTVSSGITVA